MNETEPVVLSQLVTGFWRAVLGDTVAVRVVARTKLFVPCATASIDTTGPGHRSSMLA